MKSLDQLLDQQSAWLILRDWFVQAKNSYEILSTTAEDAGRELVGMQLSTKSPLGAVLYETGGILIENGWLRILGSGHFKLPRGLFTWNFGKTFEQAGQQPSHLLVADDVVGGLFAINAGGIGTEIGKIYYYHPLSKTWQNCGFGYSEFLGWALAGDLDYFYQAFRWQYWQQDLKKVQGNQIFNLNDRQTIEIEDYYTAEFAPDNLGYEVA